MTCLLTFILLLSLSLSLCSLSLSTPSSPPPLFPSRGSPMRHASHDGSGSIFTIVGARVNVRVRQRLFESLVRQEIGFFDTTKTGDLTSRLASDCTKVGDQVTVNVNVFLR